MVVAHMHAAKIGEGRHSTVFRATYHNTDVAVKIVTKKQKRLSRSNSQRNQRASMSNGRRMSRLAGGQRRSTGNYAGAPTPLVREASKISINSIDSNDLLQSAVQFKDYFSNSDFRSRMWQLTYVLLCFYKKLGLTICLQAPSASQCGVRPGHFQQLDQAHAGDGVPGEQVLARGAALDRVPL